jgi:glycosyltransferase involved in cell wall biosynthesis
MKIFQVITLFDGIYGAQKHVFDLSLELKKKGHDVLILTGKKGLIASEAEKNGLPVIFFSSFQRRLNPINDLIFLFRLIRFIKKEKPDYIHSHSSKAGFIARIASYLTNTPNTFTAHGWSFEPGIPFFRRSFYRILETLIGFISHRVIVVSNYGKNFAVNLKVLNPSKIQMISYGVIDPGTQRDYSSVEKNILKFIMVAGFREQKDHETLFNALYELKDEDWEISLVGDGPLLNYFLSKSKELGIESKCNFVGAISDVSEYYLNHDIKILSTNWEGLPISILEALSFGMPVVATDVAGIKEEVIDNVNGILVEQKSHLQLKNALKYLLDNKSLIKGMGIKSRELYEKEYRLDIMINKIENHYLNSIE